MTTTIITSPLGNLKLTIDNNKLTEVCYTKKKAQNDSAANTTMQQTISALKTYFKSSTHSFTTPIKLHGTDFQKSVWRALQKIPTGTVVTYGDLAKKLKTSPRAIGNACRANPITIIIPCHRVVAQKNLGGYSGKRQGKMLSIKKWLIDHEKNSLSRNW